MKRALLGLLMALVLLAPVACMDLSGPSQGKCSFGSYEEPNGARISCYPTDRSGGSRSSPRDK
jgi:hypothetical protein